MSEFPAELSTGMVHGRFIVAVIDGEDEGQDPDVIPAQGKVAFKASVGYIPVPVATGGPVTVMKGPIMGALDDEGYLCTPHPTTGEPMYRGVRLVSTDDPDMAVTGWTWSADYRLEAVNGNSMQIPAHSFALPSGSELDLTTLVKVPSSPGYGLPQAEAAVLRAEAAAQVALDVKAMADAGEFDGETGPRGETGLQGPQGLQGLPGNATMRVDTSVGTRVFITDGVTEKMVSGDTGEIDVSHLLSDGWELLQPDGAIHIQRIGNTVYLRPRNLNDANATSDVFLTGLPDGFRPRRDGNVRIPVIVGASSSASNSWALVRAYQRDVRIPRPTGTIGSKYDYAEISWATPDAWPTSYPSPPETPA